MIFRSNKHDTDLYNKLLSLSRNIFFYKEIELSDTFETRVYLMLFHFSIILKIFQVKKSKFNQKSYESLFHAIENNLRELGFGDVSVNKKMKDMNKLLYDILLKIGETSENEFKINKKILLKYFKEINEENNDKYSKFERYFNEFYNFCFELPLNNVVRDAIKFN